MQKELGVNHVVEICTLERFRKHFGRRALTTENGAVSSSLHNLLHDSLLSLSIHLRASIALGIDFLMTVKPDLVGSLITVVVAIILGLAFSLPAKIRDRQKVQA